MKFSRNLIKISKKRMFELISPEEYVFNRKKSKFNTLISQTKLQPLVPYHDPNLTDIKLVGVPINKLQTSQQPQLLDLLAINHPDILFIQQDPMPYIVRQRFQSHKAALNEVEDYSVKGVENLNTPIPITWEEAIVDLLVLDMSYANQIHTKLDYTKGFITYSYPNLQLISTHDNLTNKFIAAITDYIIADKWSPYHEISNVLFQALMGKQKVVLGDMPELLLRQILGNTLTINEVKDIFKMVLSKIENLASNNTFNLDGNELYTNEKEKNFILPRVTNDLFSHIFQAPRDLYITAMLKNVARTAFSTVAFVGTPHFYPIQKYWIPPPSGINFTQATSIPERISNETNEDLIEKQAIFEVLLNTRLWAEKYIFNPFPYINQDFTKINNLDELKKTFFLNLKKYEMFRDKILDQFITKKLEYDNNNKEALPHKEVKKLTSF